MSDDVTVRIPKSRLRSMTIILATAALVAPTAVWAAHQFPDVGDTNQFHDEIAWMADNGISTGYADGTFRPGAPVTRQAMAAFMERLDSNDVFTTPSEVEAMTATEVISTSLAALGGDSGLRTCITDAYVPARDGLAVATASFSGRFDNSTGSYYLRVQVSEEGGPWVNATNDNSPVSGDATTASTADHTLTYLTSFSLTSGTSYRFAIQYLEDEPVAPLQLHECQLQVVDHPA